MFSFDYVKDFDPEVAKAMEDELGRQRNNLELIASENLVSEAVMAAMGSHLTNKYAEGYPGKRYYGGCQYVDVVENLAIERGFDIVSGGTDNHLMLVDLRKMGLTGKDMEKLLDSVHITCNKNTVPNDPQSPFVTSGLRLGTPAVTSRGLKEDDMVQIAEAIKLTIIDHKLEEAEAIVKSLTEKYPIYQGDKF